MLTSCKQGLEVGYKKAGSCKKAAVAHDVGHDHFQSKDFNSHSYMSKPRFSLITKTLVFALQGYYLAAISARKFVMK